MTDKEMADVVANVIDSVKAQTDDQLHQVAILKTAANQIENRLQAEALRQAMYNVFNNK